MELVIISIILYSTYTERYNCTPSQKTKRGNWSGQRGESMFIPSTHCETELLYNFYINMV